MRFLNQLFLQNKSIKQSHFLHVDTNSQKLKVVRKVLVELGLVESDVIFTLLTFRDKMVRILAGFQKFWGMRQTSCGFKIPFFPIH